MDLSRPRALLLMVLVPALILLARWSRSRRATDWASLGASGRPPGRRSGAWIIVFAALVAALSGPRLGRVSGSDLPPGHDVVLLVDASRSMAAEDAIPNRMGAVVSAAEALIKEIAREQGNRVAVVAFAGRAEPRCPLTEDLGAVLESLRSIRPGAVTPGGTDLGVGLDAALDSFDDQETADGRSIVVLTDGEDHVGSWPRLMDRLRTAKVVVHGVTVGDAERGHPVPVGEASEALRFRGEVVLSRRSDEALRAVSEATGGVLIPIGRSRADLSSLYRDTIAPTERRVREVTRPPERIERYSLLVAAALGLIGSATWPSMRKIGPLALLCVVIGAAGPGTESERAARAVTEGQAAFRAGDYKRALDSFETASRLAPHIAIPRYDVAATLFRLGRYEDAGRLYDEVRPVADPALRAKIDYALGNVAVALGRFKEALGHYDSCLTSTAEGPEIAGLKQDARMNRTFAARLVPPPSTPDPEGSRSSTAPTRPKPGSPEKSTDDRPEGDSSPSPGTPAEKPGESAGPQSRGRGSGSASENSGTPEQQLDAMLDEVRKAREARTGAAPPASKASTDRKDW